MTIPNVFNSTARVATWDGAGILDALIAEINANGAGNGISVTNNNVTGFLIEFTALPGVPFSLRQGSTSNFIAVGIAGDNTIAGAGSLNTAPTGTGADWSGEEEHDWSAGAIGAGSKMWTVFLDDALFVLVSNTANSVYVHALHLGEIYVPTTAGNDVAAGRDGLGFLMGTPDAMDNGSVGDWMQNSANASSLIHIETGAWGNAGVSGNQISSTYVIPPGSGYSHTPPIPAQIGVYIPTSIKFIGVMKYIGIVHTAEAPTTVKPHPDNNQGWLHFHDSTFAEDTVIIWDKTVTP